jgi:two-component system chemotaxis response regulator CheB
MKPVRVDWPDVIVLDVEMPRMDGITFLRKLMAQRPTPVVICSTLTEKGAETTMQALSAGAVAIVTKPRIGLKQFLVDSAEDVVGAVRAAAQANVRRLAPAVKPKLTADAILAGPGPTQAMHETTDQGGGHRHLHRRHPGPGSGADQTARVGRASSSSSTCRRNSPRCSPSGSTACARSRCARRRTATVSCPGRALIAPGGRHMMLKRSGAQYYVEVADGPLVNRHKPSVDVLFRSVARSPGATRWA